MFQCPTLKPVVLGGTVESGGSRVLVWGRREDSTGGGGGLEGGGHGGERRSTYSMPIY